MEFQVVDGVEGGERVPVEEAEPCWIGIDIDEL